MIVSKVGKDDGDWLLGRIFLYKYQFVMDNDNNLIGIYKDYKEENKNEKEEYKKINKSINELENAFEKLSNENTRDHEVMNERVRVLNDKIYDYNDRMDDLTVKMAPLESLSIFKDSGGGSVDTAKAMIKFLEEKLNKIIKR